MTAHKAEITSFCRQSRLPQYRLQHHRRSSFVLTPLTAFFIPGHPSPFGGHRNRDPPLPLDFRENRDATW